MLPVTASEGRARVCVSVSQALALSLRLLACLSLARLLVADEITRCLLSALLLLPLPSLFHVKRCRSLALAGGASSPDSLPRSRSSR